MMHPQEPVNRHVSRFDAAKRARASFFNELARSIFKGATMRWFRSVRRWSGRRVSSTSSNYRSTSRLRSTG